MAVVSALPVFPSFDMRDQATIGPRWTKWLQRFELFAAAYNITNATQKRALLLHSAGEEVYDVFETLTDTGNAQDYAVAKEKLSTYFEPQVNEDFEIFKFQEAVQEENESLDQFVARLRKLAQSCGFADQDKQIKSQIILKGTSLRLRRKAIREKLTLQQLIDAGRAFEISDRQACTIERAKQSNEVPVNALKIPNMYPNKQRYTSQTYPQQKKQNVCYSCGKDYPHEGGKMSCPAWGKQCRICKKQNHFARCCKSSFGWQTKTGHKQENRQGAQKEIYKYKKAQNEKHSKCVLAVCNENDSNTEDSAEEYIHVMNLTSKLTGLPKTNVSIQDVHIEMLIDTGASVNVLPLCEIRKLECKPDIKRTSLKLMPFGSTQPLPICGKASFFITTKVGSGMADFYIIDKDITPLLGYKTATELGLVSVINKLTENKNLPSQNIKSLENIFAEFPTVTEGIGKLTGVEISLEMDPKVKPVVNTRCRIPFHLRTQVEEQLEHLESLDIIEKVTGPTQWVSPVVVVPKKNGKIRICVDLREVNKGLLKEKHQMPTMDDIISDLSGMAIFSKLDLRDGYHQLVLAEDSRSITTFATHKGLFRYKRLPFGLASAAEIFQKTIQTVIHDVQGARNVSDDVMGATKTVEEHAKLLRQILSVFRERRLTINKEKCIIGGSMLNYNGHIFTQEGVQTDAARVEAIKNLPRPSNAKELRSLMGMLTYCSRFIKNFSGMAVPLFKLTHKEENWQWGVEQEEALKAIMQALGDSTSLGYFDVNQQTAIYVDASPVGLGAILTQTSNLTPDKHSVVAYASRTLTQTEQHYSQLEREALAIVWAAERFHLFVYGSRVIIYTDHKPLVTIYNESKRVVSPRILKWKLRLQVYDAVVKYAPGCSNPADYMSRHPVQIKEKSSTQRREESTEAYVNSLLQNEVSDALGLDMVKKATQEDSTLCAVMYKLQGKDRQFPADIRHSEFKQLWNIHEELAINTDATVLLKGHQIVLPEKLRDQAINIAHEGHQGIVKTKMALRTAVWFPGLEKRVEMKVANCLPCLATTNVSIKQPILFTNRPEEPWQNVNADFSGPFPSGEYLLVIVDQYSHFPEIEILSSLQYSTVGPKMEKIFSTYGLPEQITTDNGPPFSSKEFENFCVKLGIQHRKITPRWPRANGVVERFMRTLNKAIKTAVIEGRNWKLGLYNFLRNYRSTPHSVTGISPAELLFGRKMRTKLPMGKPCSAKDTSFVTLDAQAREHWLKWLSRQRVLSNRKDHTVMVGEKVIVKRETKGKLKSLYEPELLEVIKVKGSMITAQSSGGKRVVTRNISQFKVIPSSVKGSGKAIECQDLEDDDDFVVLNQDRRLVATNAGNSNDQAIRHSTRVRIKPNRLIEH